MRFFVLLAFAVAAAGPAGAQRGAITVLDGARKTPVRCEATMTVATVSTAPIECVRMDVIYLQKGSVVTDVPAGQSLVLTDARLYCDFCDGQDFSIAFYGEVQSPTVMLSMLPFSLRGVAPVADWHGVSPFLVVPGGSRLRIGGVVPAGSGGGPGGVINVVATGYLVRSDYLGQ